MNTRRIRNRRSVLLANDWQTLTRESYEYFNRDSQWVGHTRELYDRGNAVTVLPYDLVTGTVHLCRQFRLPAFVNGLTDGMLLETPGGSIDPGEDPRAAIIRETREELGLLLGPLTPVFETYMSPGSVTEKIYAFAAPVRGRTGRGGGLAEEGEEIEAVTLDFRDVFEMALAGEIRDAKTYGLILWAARGPFSAKVEQK